MKASKQSLMQLATLCAFIVSSSPSFAQSSAEHDKWLKEQFSEKHQQITPIVAVADMFYACNKVRKVDPIGYQFKDLVNKMDKNQLAEKLLLCLGEDTLQSEVALNFGLLGCFENQLLSLSKAARKEKMQQVKETMLSLSREERQKSFTKCVTSQAIKFIQ